MSGELAIAEPVTAIVPAASFDLQQWGRDAQLVAAVAENLVKTSFVPKSYQGRTLEATAAILTGQEIGLKPMAALRSIDIIDGTPAMRAILLRALVQSHGHEIWTEDSTSTRAVVAGRRRDGDKVERSVWDLDRARTQNLIQKDNWKKMPTAMLLARATAECARLIDADGLLGIPYSTEELEDLAVERPSDAAPKRASSTARRKPLPEKVQAIEPPLEGEGSADAPEAGELVDADQPVAAGEVAWNVAPIPQGDSAEQLVLDEPPVDWQESPRSDG